MVSPDFQAGAAAEAAQSADSQSSASTTGGSDGGTPSGQADGQVTSIDNLDRYTHNGRPLKDYVSGYMRQQDYTSKTQEIAQERKFYDNLDVDLERVKSNPALADQFRQVYPEKFHNYLRHVLAENRGQTPPGQQQAGQRTTQQQFAQLDPKTQAEIRYLLENNRQREVQAIGAQIDAVFAKMSEKYPFADEEAVVARGQALFEQLKKANPGNQNLQISEKHWEALWKSQNDRNQQIAEARYNQKVKAQINASRQGRDVASGGGTPGQAPRTARTIKEATAHAMADIDSGAI